MVDNLLGENIKKLRLEKGLNISKLAELAGVARSTISQIETGSRTSLRSDSIEKIAQALQVDIKDLYCLEEHEVYEISDLEDIIEVIFQDDIISLDDVPLNDDEIRYLSIAFKSSINSLRISRK